MFHQFLLHLLKAKLDLIALAKIPTIAALIVLGTTGFVVSGTIQAKGDDDGDRIVHLTIKPLESKTCVDALIAQTETLLELDALAGDGQSQLRHLRDRASENADDQHKTLDPAALRAQTDTSSGRIRDELAAARKKVMDAADLGKCQDGNADTGVSLDVIALRATYDGILRDFDAKLGAILDEAQQKFDALVAAAPTEVITPDNEKDHDGDKEEEEDDDDD
ncbi:MAG TPA: hypothetical protein VEN31_07325 [Candidatus Bathyarchaeia archaeon]|nr:hypothetical protein [Candidatus Bathyarchaeia archaeon]